MLANSTTIRAFVGVPLLEPARQKVLQAQRRLEGRLANPALVRWERAANLHATLFFLGDIAETLVPSLREQLAARVGEQPAFRLELGQITTFGGNRPRLFAIMTGQGTAELEALHGGVVAAVGELGFAPETRPYRPHFTIGRVRRRQRLSAATAERLLEPVASSLSGATMEVTEVVLLQSRLAPTGATYHHLAALPLSQPPQGQASLGQR